MRLRDRFIQIHGAIAGRGPSKRAYSNTGIVGVSETIHWRRSRPLDCFLVSWSQGGHGRTRRVYFGDHRPRSQALRMAVELRTARVQSSEFKVQSSRFSPAPEAPCQ